MATIERRSPAGGDDGERPLPPQADSGRQAAKDAAVDAVLNAIVAAAPQLPYPVRARLAFLLGGHHTRRDDKDRVEPPAGHAPTVRT